MKKSTFHCSTSCILFKNGDKQKQNRKDVICNRIKYGLSKLILLEYSVQSAYIVNIISTYPIILEWKFSSIKKTYLKTSRKTINKPVVNRKSPTLHLPGEKN